jgi:DNA-binding MarR family transcriptional regulator
VSSTSSTSPAGDTSPRWLAEHEQTAWRAYVQMQQQLMARLNRSLTTGAGLSDGDYGVLVSLSEAPQQRLRAFELARTLQWEKSRLSHQLTRMERRGLVRREECEDDARGAFVTITDAGRTAIEAAAPVHVEDVRRWFVDLLTPDQLATMTSIAETVLAALGTTGDACPDNGGECPDSNSSGCPDTAC